MKDLLDKITENENRDFSPELDGITGIDIDEIDNGEYLDLFDQIENDIEIYG